MNSSRTYVKKPKQRVVLWIKKSFLSYVLFIIKVYNKCSAIRIV